MAFENQPNGLPIGYSLLPSKVLVPHCVKDWLLDCRREETAHIESTAPEHATLPPPAPRSIERPSSPSSLSKMIRVYSANEVEEIECNVLTLNRTNDRRRSMETLLQDLKRQEPIGYREYVRVPRNYLKRLETLETVMPNFRHVVHQVRLLLTLQKAGRNMLSLPPLLLTGDPGVGKTFFALELSKVMGLGCRVVHMESATSGMVLTGLEQFYATASPGMVFEILVKGQHANPVLVVDELDKVSTESRHPPANALYQLLEQNTARQFRDHSCPDLVLDASHINWIITANDPSAIPPPLLSRMTVIHVPSPTRKERSQIAKQIYSDLRAKNSWGRNFEAVLPERSADMLTTIPGSVRRMQSVLRLAFAYALSRGSGVIEVRDLNRVLLSDLSIVALEDIPAQGNA